MSSPAASLLDQFGEPGDRLALRVIGGQADADLDGAFADVLGLDRGGGQQAGDQNGEQFPDLHALLLYAGPVH